jgi:adenosine/AMP kinase
MQLVTVRVEKPEATNFVLGQTHFIKSVEDIHEALVGAVPGIRFGLAFCEASGKCLVRWSGTDEAMTELARKNAMAIAAGHSFLLFLGEGFYPLNVLNTLKMVPEVCRIFCATANPTEVVVAETEQGRGILGVVDGSPRRASRARTTSPGGRVSCGRSGTSCERTRRGTARGGPAEARRWGRGGTSGRSSCCPASCWWRSPA